MTYITVSINAMLKTFPIQKMTFRIILMLLFHWLGAIVPVSSVQRLLVPEPEPGWPPRFPFGVRFMDENAVRRLL
ncbi:uncharacterized protein BCR38DRAFT_439987 [Pseudomassariella vexata]|uniref:Uncharacterized protein n=1 Tax=Pseudomassariella vexata TaxID=1141098 RepID=A0A1Y2DQ41_9PEZI|nr:uncharacterized protein BCR38DRAFT_439987 [Pseudomassariella vexata]ORY61370.1 hypothetical protein BCR38DRAFT_439987 [Pseudomassariella vexata]